MALGFLAALVLGCSGSSDDFHYGDVDAGFNTDASETGDDDGLSGHDQSRTGSYQPSGFNEDLESSRHLFEGDEGDEAERSRSASFQPQRPPPDNVHKLIQPVTFPESDQPTPLPW